MSIQVKDLEDRTDQIRRQHAATRPTPENIAWVNAHADIAHLLRHIAAMHRECFDHAAAKRNHDAAVHFRAQRDQLVNASDPAMLESIANELAGDFRHSARADSLRVIAKRLRDALPGDDALLEPVAVLSSEAEARECLFDVISHHADLAEACKAKGEHLQAQGDPNGAAYWIHQIGVLERMKGQAERALARMEAPRRKGVAA